MNYSLSHFLSLAVHTLTFTGPDVDNEGQKDKMLSGQQIHIVRLGSNIALSSSRIQSTQGKRWRLFILPQSLTNIFQDSIESGTVPSRWKSANVCGVFKKGKKSDHSNNRPISLTCIASKILEHIVHSHGMKNFEHYTVEPHKGVARIFQRGVTLGHTEVTHQIVT